MDIDSGAVPTSKEEDLSQYNLDEYDDDVQTTSEFHVLISPTVINILFYFSHGSIHQYQRSNVLQRQRRRPLYHTKRCMPFPLNFLITDGSIDVFQGR